MDRGGAMDATDAQPYMVAVLDEAPELPAEPIVSLETVEELPPDVLDGRQLETLQAWGIIESDAPDTASNGEGSESAQREAVEQGR
jgi:hypothetical protein